MPQLLRNIHELIEAFRRYAGSEGGALTRAELKQLLEHEFADVIVKPHDPATVDEVLRLLDEDNTGTVEFKEFLFLVFKIAQACFKTFDDCPREVWRLQESESSHPEFSTGLGQEQRSGTEVGRDGRGQQYEGGDCRQSEQAFRGQGRVGTHTQDQESYSVQVSSHDSLAESQRQETVSQWTQVRRQEDQTPPAEDKSQTRENRSEKQSWNSQQTSEAMTGTPTQACTGDSQTQRSSCNQNRRTETCGQDRSQAGRAVTGYNQAQAGSYTQTQAQMTEQSWNPQTRNTSAHTQGSVDGSTRGTEAHGQDKSQAGQAATGHFQTREGSCTQTVEHDRSQSESQAGVQEQGPSQMQSGMSQGWTQVSNSEVGEPVLGGQTQTATSTVTERRGWSSSRAAMTGGQEERAPTVVRDEWVDDHTREIVIRSQAPGSLRSGCPSAQSQGAVRMEEKTGLSAKGLDSDLKSGKS